jgi:hypothetical protein
MGGKTESRKSRLFLQEISTALAPSELVFRGLIDGSKRCAKRPSRSMSSLDF